MTKERRLPGGVKCFYKAEDYDLRDEEKSLSSAGEDFHDTQEQKGLQNGDDS